MYAGNSRGCVTLIRKRYTACNSWTHLLAVRLPCFVMRQDIFLRLAVHNVDVVISKVDWLYPVTSSINHHRDASTRHAARDQHRHQACG